MKLNSMKTLWILVGVIFSAGCSMHQGKMEPLQFVSSSFSGGQYLAKVDNAVIIQDASSSMGFSNQRNLQDSKNLLTSLNQSLPANLNLNLGLRSFGHSLWQPSEMTTSVHGLTHYSRENLQKEIDSITSAGGNSPLGVAILEAGEDLKGTSGNSAIIVVSDGLKDGLQMDTAPIAAEKVKAMLNDRVCIYTVQVGDSAEGQALLDKVVQAGQCGFAESAEDLTSSAGMKLYIEKVFLSPPPQRADMRMDSDGDGVMDDLDKCPNTPKGTIVDKNGCPLDKDGDGVSDDLDRCPDTPKGAMVDQSGCPLDTDRDGVPDDLDKCPGTPRGAAVDTQGCALKLSLHINFDTDQAVIKPEFKSELEKAAAFIKANSNIPYVVLGGHTDSRGTDSYNQKLSERRAAAVRQELVENYGVDDKKIRSKGYGESRPVGDNSTKQGRAQNRRVEVLCCAFLPD